MKTFPLLAAIATLTLTGCDVWFLGGTCERDELGDFEAIGYLDPFTAQCMDGGGSGSGNTCGDYGGGARLEPVPTDWALCYTDCTELAEETCLMTDGCRAGYISDCAEGASCNDPGYTFSSCWATAPSGPERGDCSGLDAYECSRHDDCIAQHFPMTSCDGSGNCAPVSEQPGNFERCVAEPEVAIGCYTDEECPAEHWCNASVVCDPPPDCDPATGCPPVCYGSCVPESGGAGSCYGNVLCESLPPDCPAGTVPGIENDCWTGQCIAYDDCDPPLDPGTCHGEVFCDGLPPICPTGSVPGVLDGCWSLLCIPENECEDPPSP